VPSFTYTFRANIKPLSPCLAVSAAGRISRLPGKTQIGLVSNRSVLPVIVLPRTKSDAGYVNFAIIRSAAILAASIGVSILLAPVLLVADAAKDGGAPELHRKCDEHWGGCEW
jgi:hypothetical protein